MRRPVIIALAVLPILATQAHAEEPGRYSALDTIRRAQVGTFSPRLAPPVRVVPAEPRAGKPEPRQFERMDCRPDPSRPLDRAIVCRPMESEKVKPNN
jgi:hypothetical protein